MADTDGDGSFDAEELGIGTNPHLADTDGDTLSDAWEINNDFDPLHPNPDGDHLRDDEEYAENTDPFDFDPTVPIAIQITILGAALGDVGETLAVWGWIEEDTYTSVYYMAGWIGSGLAGFGDLRDVIGSASRLDFWDTLLNTLGIVPALGDAVKVGKVIDKVVTFAKARCKNLQPIVRWTVKNFENAPFFDQLLGYLGYSDEVIDKYCRQGVASAGADSVSQTSCTTFFFAQVAKKNGPKIVNDVIAKGGGFFRRTLTSQQWTNITNRANDVTLWGNAASRPATLTQRRAVESAVEILPSNGYDILYVQREGPLYVDAAGIEHFLRVGPDLVAVNRQTGATVITEIKGLTGDISFNTSRFRGSLTVGGIRQRFFEPERLWLETNHDRYLKGLDDAAIATGNPQLRDAADRLEQVADYKGDYEAILFGYGTIDARFGKFDRIWERLTNVDNVRVDTYLIHP